jgi:hypothetical protein
MPGYPVSDTIDRAVDRITSKPKQTLLSETEWEEGAQRSPGTCSPDECGGVVLTGVLVDEVPRPSDVHADPLVQRRDDPVRGKPDRHPTQAETGTFVRETANGSLRVLRTMRASSQWDRTGLRGWEEKQQGRTCSGQCWSFVQRSQH